MCSNGDMNVLSSVLIMNYNKPLVPQVSICPVRGMPAHSVPRALSDETSDRPCSPGLQSSPCPPMPRLTRWSVWGIARKRRAHHLSGLSSPWRLPPVLRYRPPQTGHISMVDAGRGAAVLSRPASILNPHQRLCLPLQTTSSLIHYLCHFKLIPSPSHAHLLPTTHPNILPQNLNPYLTQHG